jgi:hypothetical protein
VTARVEDHLEQPITAVARTAGRGGWVPAAWGAVLVVVVGFAIVGQRFAPPVAPMRLNAAPSRPVAAQSPASVAVATPEPWVRSRRWAEELGIVVGQRPADTDPRRWIRVFGRPTAPLVR